MTIKLYKKYDKVLFNLCFYLQGRWGRKGFYNLPCEIDGDINRRELNSFINRKIRDLKEQVLKVSRVKTFHIEPNISGRIFKELCK